MTKIKAETVVEIPASIYALDAMTLRVVKFWLDADSEVLRLGRAAGAATAAAAAQPGWAAAPVCVCVCVVARIMSVTCQAKVHAGHGSRVCVARDSR